MAAIMRVDIAGAFPAIGADGRARTDGIPGAVVTLNSIGGGGSTHEFELLWVPVEDTTAEASLAVTGDPLVWEFTFGAAAQGPYLVKLTVDRGLPTEATQQRRVEIRSPEMNLSYPALNEVADPTASLVNQGAGVVDANDNNEILAGKTDWDGYHAFFVQTVAKLERGNAPGITIGSTTTSILLNAQEIVGGFTLRAQGDYNFKALGLLTVAAAGLGEVRLYDLGAPGAPIAPVLRSTLTFANVDSGTYVEPSAVLTPVATPAAPNNDEIHAAERHYEVRTHLDPTAVGMVGDSLLINQVSLRQ